MKLLNGQEVAEFIKQRHYQQVRGLQAAPKLAIVRMGNDPATSKYLAKKSEYGSDIGALVQVFAETAETILDRIHQLNTDSDVTGIIVQLPLSNAKITDQALAAVLPAKDVDGLAPKTLFETATPKAIVWLLSAYNVELKGNKIAVVGQGRLVGKPLADRLEASGLDVERLDIHSKNIKKTISMAHIVICATGRAGLIKAQDLQAGAVVVDAGSPAGEVDKSVWQRNDLVITPNPGGVGPMTVAALFDNLLIAAQNAKS